MRWWAFGWLGIAVAAAGQVVEQHPLNGMEEVRVPAVEPVAVVLEASRADFQPFVIANGDTLWPEWDAPAEGEPQRFTWPVWLPENADSIRVFAGRGARLHFLHVPPPPFEAARAESMTGSPCNPPAWVPPSQWRAGLPPPSKQPVATPTHHVIVHHSASTLSDTDYVKVVRAIYLYHTDVRKWDDIGYNFVIDPAGTIYLARDPQGVADPDRIKGAHFCGKNSYTMGVCLLGHYQSQPPPQRAVAALLHLLTWKFHKEGLAPHDSALHPPGSASAAWLPVIAPHRAGCATACPGDSVAVRMPWIRDRVADSLAQCVPAGIGQRQAPRRASPSETSYFDAMGRRLGRPDGRRWLFRGGGSGTFLTVPSRP